MTNIISRRDILKLSGAASLGMLLYACGVDPTQVISTLTPTFTPLPTETPQPTETSTPTATAIPNTLRGYADSIKFGLGVFMPGTDEDLLKIAAEHFNVAQIFISWPGSEPTEGNFDLDPITYYGKFARQNKMAMQALSIIWAADLPDWVKKGKFNRDSLIATMEKHIRGLMSSHRGYVREWIVVNEPYLPPYRKDDLFYNIIGSDYIEIAFQIARESDPKAILIYNDAPNHTAKGFATENTRKIAKDLKSKGLIDGVGLQMHLLQYEDTPPDKQDVIETMRSYDLPVYVTEFDVNLKNVTGSQEQRWQFQADVYRDMLEASLKSGVCAGFSVFGLRDDLSVWETIPTLEGYSMKSEPLPFDSIGNPKPSYYAMLDVLKQYAEKNNK